MLSAHCGLPRNAADAPSHGLRHRTDACVPMEQPLGTQAITGGVMSNMYRDQHGVLVATRTGRADSCHGCGALMWSEGIHITALGVELGQEARAPWMVRRDALAVADARRTRQRSVCVADASGPELAVGAGREALRSHELATGEPAFTGLHLHASTYDRPDHWSVACFVLNQLAIANGSIAWDICAMSNSVLQGLELAAGLLFGGPDLDAALIAAGFRFGGVRFGGRYGRYTNDPEVLRGDGRDAVVVSQHPESFR